MNRWHLVSLSVLLVFLSAAGRGAGPSDVADAVMKGDKAALRTLLRQKVDVNAPQVDGATALHWAVYRDDLDVADMLIRAGARVNVTNREGVTPLAMASLYANAAMIRRLLTGGADATQRGANGETTLMLAARNGNPEAIKVLLAAGADVNAKENLRGTTALMWAVEQRHPLAVKALLDAGADFSARSGPAGLPRNYTAPHVDRAAVDAAARRHAAAAAAGRTYEEQLEWDVAQGAKIAMGFRGTLTAGGVRGERNLSPLPGPGGATSAAAPPAATSSAAVPPEPPPSDDNDEADVIVAGLVGRGGGSGRTDPRRAARVGRRTGRQNRHGLSGYVDRGRRARGENVVAVAGPGRRDGRCLATGVATLG